MNKKIYEIWATTIIARATRERDVVHGLERSKRIIVQATNGDETGGVII